MTCLEHRQVFAAEIAPACAVAGLDRRTLQGWWAGGRLSRGDRRPDAAYPYPMPRAP
jgi:hypothetical protein